MVFVFNRLTENTVIIKSQKLYVKFILNIKIVISNFRFFNGILAEKIQHNKGD